MVDLVNSVEKFGKKWYGKRKLGEGPPTKMETPYGGRIIWTLPGETKIVCHLKDKNKIRHKKRLHYTILHFGSCMFLAFIWFSCSPMTIQPLFENTPVLNNNFEH